MHCRFDKLGKVIKAMAHLAVKLLSCVVSVRVKEQDLSFFGYQPHEFHGTGFPATRTT
jgi:hypothetical protein